MIKHWLRKLVRCYSSMYRKCVILRTRSGHIFCLIYSWARYEPLRRCYICNTFSHWLRPCSAIDRKWAQVFQWWWSLQVQFSPAFPGLAVWFMDACLERSISQHPAMHYSMATMILVTQMATRVTKWERSAWSVRTVASACHWGCCVYFEIHTHTQHCPLLWNFMLMTYHFVINMNIFHPLYILI